MKEMTKKTIGVLAVLLLLLASTGILTYAIQTQITVYEKSLDGTSAKLRNYDVNVEGRAEVLKIYDGAVVTAIGENAFLECDKITSVVVHNTVTEIGSFALGYKENENGEKIKREDFLILGRANSEAQKYADENGIPFKVYLTQPQLVSAKNAVGGAEVKWIATENSAGYNVYRKTAKSKWKKVGFAEGEATKKFIDTTAKSGTEYTYTVRAVYGGEKGSYDKKGVSVNYVKAPEVKLSNTKDGVKIVWTKSAKAAKYRVYKKTVGSDNWTKLATVKSNVTSYVYKTQNSGEKSYFTVRAISGDYKSAYQKDKSIVFLAQPSLKTLKNTTSGMKITWGKVSGAEKYRVYRKTNNGSWKKLKDVSSSVTSYHDKTVNSGTKYTYTVKAFSGKSYGSYNKGLTLYNVCYPILKPISRGTGGLKISWEKQNKADNYIVYKKNSNGKWGEIYTTKNNTTLSYTDKNVSSGLTYNYTVVAVYKKSRSSYDSKGVSGTYFTAPILSSVRCFKSEKNVISWKKTGGAKGYSVYKKIVGGKYRKIADVNGNTTAYTDKDIKVGKTYAYKICATSTEGIKSGYSKEKTVRVLNLKKPMVALTYDDGPSGDATTRILNTLEKYNGKATFFVVGSRVNSYKSQIKRAYNMGCEIGNHSNNHSTLTGLSANGVKSEINETDKKIKAVIGENPVVMRPPGGSYKNNTVKNNVGKPIIMWSVDTRDWESRNASKVVSNIKNNVRDGSIVLMHDLYGSTATATEQIVPWLVEKGYQIVTVSEMMDAKGITMQNGVAYSSAK